jgi:hypothetical protein
MSFFPPSAAHIGDSGVVCQRSTVISSFFSLTPKKYRLILFVLDISTSVLILFIFNFFFLGAFVKGLFVFNLILQI